MRARTIRPDLVNAIIVLGIHLGDFNPTGNIRPPRRQPIKKGGFPPFLMVVSALRRLFVVTREAEL